MEEIFVKEWFTKHKTGILCVPTSIKCRDWVIDLKYPGLERYVHLMKDKWSLKLATSAYSCTHDDIRGNHWEAFFI